MSRKLVAVGTERDSVMFRTRRAAGPVMGVAPSGIVERETGIGGFGPLTFPVSRFTFPVSRRTSARSVGMTGSSVRCPLSKRARHSSPTDDGSRRYCSYITCTNAALLVPKTNSLTEENLKTSDVRCETSAYCRPVAALYYPMRNPALPLAILAVLGVPLAAQIPAGLRARLEARIG